MKMPLPLLLAPSLLAAACERRAEEPVAPATSVEAPSPAPEEKNSAATSIMRPEVAEEAAVPTPPPPAEPLRETIEFGDSGAVLDEAAKAALDTLLTRPGFADGGAISLSGHSDSAGSDAQNLVMSRRRAEAVRDYLLSKGVPAERMTAIALGERRPREPNAHPDGSDFPEGRQRNRRVEIVVEPPPVPLPAEPPPAATESRDRAPLNAMRPKP